MTLTNIDNTSILASVATLGVVIAYFHTRKSKLPLPPGPTRLPLIGGLLSIPTTENWVWFAKLSKQTGSDVIHFDILGAHTIVLNSRQAVAELLERRSAMYSDRPHMVMASELTGWNRTLGMSPYARAREMRKLLLGSMNVKSMQEWRPQLEQEAIRFLQRCLRSPEQLRNHIRHAASATAVRLTYGYQPKEENDELIEAAERAMDSFTKASTPGGFVVDILPILKYFPWAEFQRTATVWRRELDKFVEMPMRSYYDRMNKGQAEPSFVASWLENVGPKDDASLVPWAAVSLYAGGSDTTVSAITSFFVAMLHYPAVQKKAQAEIDRVIGKERLPTFTDRDSLPYVENVYKEVYRWIPLGTIGVPHRYMGEEDDEFNGMRIPASSMVIANAWALFQDPEVYKDPTVFDPERYSGPEPEPDSEDVAFGFGRRRCPGILVAQSSLWISIALTLAVFDIEPWIGEDGKPELPSLDYDGVIIRHPKPFRYRLAPRSEKARRMVEGVSV